MLRKIALKVERELRDGLPVVASGIREYYRRERESVADMFEYLRWRGDISFAEKRLSEIDSIILSMMVYVDFDALGLCGEEYLCNLAKDYCLDNEYKSVKLGLIIPSKKINRLFCTAAKCRRFGNVKVSDYVVRTSEEEVCQFAAATYHLPGKRMAVTFRGTDDTIVGWREDFCMSYVDEIPAQKLAREYLLAVAEKYPDEKIYLTGHSKGGNLSLYAAMKATSEVKARIVKVYCHDGPGLSYSNVTSPEFAEIRRKVAVYLPQSSVVGTMFERGDKYAVVKSSAVGAVQHDPFSWELDGPVFIRLSSLSERGKKNEEQFRTKMRQMTADEKREFVELFFSIVSATGAKTLSDFSGKGVKNVALLLKNYTGLEKQQRDLIVTLMIKLFDLKKEKTK